MASSLGSQPKNLGSTPGGGTSLNRSNKMNKKDRKRFDKFLKKACNIISIPWTYAILFGLAHNYKSNGGKQ